MERREEYLSDDELNQEELDELISLEIAKVEVALAVIAEVEGEDEQQEEHKNPLGIEEEEEKVPHENEQEFDAAAHPHDAWNGYMDEDRHDSWEEEPDYKWYNPAGKQHHRNESKNHLMNSI